MVPEAVVDHVAGFITQIKPFSTASKPDVPVLRVIFSEIKIVGPPSRF